LSNIFNKILSALTRAKQDEKRKNARPETSSAVPKTEPVAQGASACDEPKPEVETPISGVNVHAAAVDDLAAYDYALPERLIAQTPRLNRERARMMVVDRANQKILHRHCSDVVEFLRPNDVIVLNNTKVVPARLIGSRVNTGGRWEGLFLHRDPRGIWEIMSKTRGYLRPGEQIRLMNSHGTGADGFLEVVAHTEEKTLIVRPLFDEGEDTFSFLDRVGWVPIPPYIRCGRMVPEDRENYQTVYAKEPGAVAAPTAGLHFTKELLEDIRQMGVAICPVTLHVGAGTFKPIKTSKISEHHMHAEYATISDEVVRTIKERKARGGRVIAIGTTSVRTLESASNVKPDGTIDSTGLNDYKLRAFTGQTDLFIRPPYNFKTVDAIFTNFHLPKSTLIILIRTFGGDELIKRAYEVAIADDYRFYSYGDAMLIL
jgi:S-adenosylmethionine:tRNA ribosyltransferase-isomerase